MAVGPALRPAQAPGACLANARHDHPSAARPTCRTNWSPLSEGARGSRTNAPWRKAAYGRFAPYPATTIGTKAQIGVRPASRPSRSRP